MGKKKNAAEKMNLACVKKCNQPLSPLILGFRFEAVCELIPRLETVIN